MNETRDKEYSEERDVREECADHKRGSCREPRTERKRTETEKGRDGSCKELSSVVGNPECDVGEVIQLESSLAWTFIAPEPVPAYDVQ